ncbi:putative bifunctional diguanylate cyclase/phosphodiesterase [Qipengyuania spongiae]|uniref:EAL domain-containing protein n=1 Tax=Qipengyuania spongiae TaxID=2909673 RepID=A0ABY5SVL8_9SPHN|nr:EAL domain-containing protein [Qipengyuania spongiae]UVI38597.1 EAL domain-containing protein [Qipengyuania spongiae]
MTKRHGTHELELLPIPDKDDDALTDRVRLLLVKTLYTHPSSLAIGAINGIVSSLAAAYLSGERLLYAFSAILAIVAVARVILADLLPRSEKSFNIRWLEIVYEIGALSYAGMIGIIAAATMVMDLPAGIELLMVANAVGYGTGICARNAGRPVLALSQLAWVALPIMVACLWIGGLAMYLLAVNMLLLLPAMASITLSVFRVLRESISSAEKSRQLAESMQILARTDVVTKLANRAGLNHHLEEAIAGLGDRSLAMFWIDIDRFKEVNDLLGHQTGDKVLAEIGARLADIVPQNGVVARFGGDEFVMLCEVEEKRACERLATRILNEINRPIRFQDERLEVKASVGIAAMPEDGEDAESFMQHADLALYHAKANGKNQVAFFDSSMTRELVRRREIEGELRAALQRDELSIFFQPIIDLATGKIRSFEALVRWFHPEKGELRPDEFIPVAEETGAIVTLGNWITAQAARAAAQWPDDITLAVNLSPLQIKAPGAALGILNSLRDAGLSPTRLELEVTETLFLEDSPTVVSFIEELSAVGVRFALDDFGTGYSSLGYINKWPFSKIKVDRSFVSGPNVGRKSDAIIRAVSQMAATLDMDIVAEGLETIEQVSAVRDAGCNLGQGYYFSRPVPDYLAAMLLAQDRESDNIRHVFG